MYIFENIYLKKVNLLFKMHKLLKVPNMDILFWERGKNISCSKLFLLKKVSVFFLRLRAFLLANTTF